MKLTELYESATGEKAMYRKGMSDYHTLRYVRWLEEKISPPCDCPRCGGPEVELHYEKNCTCSDYSSTADSAICPIHPASGDKP